MFKILSYGSPCEVRRTADSCVEYVPSVFRSVNCGGETREKALEGRASKGHEE